MAFKFLDLETTADFIGRMLNETAAVVADGATVLADDTAPQVAGEECMDFQNSTCLENIVRNSELRSN